GVFEEGHKVLFTIGLVTAGLTAFYMMRLVSLTFAGEFRGTPEQEHHVHEAPPTMMVPLVILAGLSVVAGFLGLPKVLAENGNPSAALLAPIFPKLAISDEMSRELSSSTEWALIVASVAVALSGLLLGWSWYARGKGRVPDRIAAASPGLYELVAE